jgi:RND family efflux transporter MFP subunit
MNSKSLLATAGVLFFVAACVAGVVLFRPHWMHGMHAAGEGSMEHASGKHLWHCGMHPQVIQDHPGTCPICHMDLTPLNEANGAPSGGPKKVLYWWDPMLGPSSISDKPGKSAMGMEMVPVYEKDASAGSSVTIDPTVVQNMGVRTTPVVRGPLETSIRAVGLRKVPQPGLHDVSLRVGGWVEKLYAATEGIHVHKGEVLFDLYSPDLLVAEEELISAAGARKSLGAGTSDVLKKEADGLLASAKRKLALWDIAQEDIDAIAAAPHAPRTVPFRSPASGAVVELSIVQGSAVQAGMKLMRVEDHSALWLDAEVYEGQVPLVSLGQSVEATLDGMPGAVFAGKVSFITPHVDHMTRTVTVRTTLDNPDAKLKPGMYAAVRIVARPVEDALLVPREAVIDTGTRKIAFVAGDQGHFNPRNVKTGLAGDGGRVQILEGLAPGEMVVTSGQFLLDVESRTTEAIDKLRSAPAASQPSEMMKDQ